MRRHAAHRSTSWTNVAGVIGGLVMASLVVALCCTVVWLSLHGAAHRT